MQHPFDGVILPADSAPSVEFATAGTQRRGFFKTAAAYAVGLLTFGVAGSVLARDRWSRPYGSRGYYSAPRSYWYTPPARRVTTYAVGEEGGGGRVTTYAVGEEGGGGRVTTYALGEEGGGIGGGRPGQVTTYALGEEGGGPVTTQALGEEGGRF